MIELHLVISDQEHQALLAQQAERVRFGSQVSISELARQAMHEGLRDEDGYLMGEERPVQACIYCGNTGAHRAGCIARPPVDTGRLRESLSVSLRNNG